MNRVGQLFTHLDRWRHVPAYQLERRADIFFSLYLAEVLETVLDVAVDPRLVPELPLHRRLFNDNPSHDNSARLDYCILSLDRQTALFVELKTDNASINAAQDARMAALTGRPFRDVVEAIVCIAQSENSAKRKYLHLLHLLEIHGCVRLPADLLGFTERKSLQGVKKLLDQVVVTAEPGEFEIKVLYVQPTKTRNDERVIDFDTFAGVVEGHDDEVSQVFARHLRRWTSAAGAAKPGPWGTRNSRSVPSG
jgi:hypothetical protein